MVELYMFNLKFFIFILNFYMTYVHMSTWFWHTPEYMYLVGHASELLSFISLYIVRTVTCTFSKSFERFETESRGASSMEFFIFYYWNRLSLSSKYARFSYGVHLFWFVHDLSLSWYVGTVICILRKPFGRLSIAGMLVGGFFHRRLSPRNR